MISRLDMSSEGREIKQSLRPLPANVEAKGKISYWGVKEWLTCDRLASQLAV